MNMNKRNVELNRTGFYFGVLLVVALGFRFLGQYWQYRQCSSSNDKPNSINDKPINGSINGSINGKPF